MTKPADKLSLKASGFLNTGSGGNSDSASNSADAKSKPVIIKKYANRRLYNTETSSYVTLEDLGEMVRSERDFLVYDAKTGEDLTHTVLTQIIVEEEGKGGQNLLPIGFLRQLIRFYGHSIEQIVPKYLELSLETLTREQEKYRTQLTSAFGSSAFEIMQEQARQNMVIFERAMSMFVPFARLDGQANATPPADPTPQQPSPAATSAEIAELKAQLFDMKAQIDRLQKTTEQG